jgi:hypothetical protein
MPLIQFDPPDESNHPIMRGGLQLDKAIRSRYISLSQQIFEPDANGKMISEEMLQIIVDAARNHIESLPESDRKDLHSTLDQIIESIDPNETNYAGLLNIVTLQLAILFTRYVRGIKEKHAYLKNRNINIARFNTSDLLLADDTDIYEKMMDVYADYSEVKKIIEERFKEFERYEKKAGTRLILNPPIGRWKYIPMIGYLTLTEIVDSIFNNIWHIGLAFDVQYVDGDASTPLGYYIHDIDHSISVDSSINIKEEMPHILEILREFRDFVRNTYKSRQIIYSIYLVLFYMIHETGSAFTFYGYFYRATIFSHLSKDEEPLSMYIKKLLSDFLDAFLDLDDAGKSIPVTYREPTKEDPTRLDITKVKEYLDITHERYMQCWKEFQVSRASQGGRRHTRRSRRNKKRRSTRRR